MCCSDRESIDSLCKRDLSQYVFVLQCIATQCCSALQCVSVCCSVLQCVAMPRSVPGNITSECGIWSFCVLQCVARHSCCELQCVAVCCSVRGNIGLKCKTRSLFCQISCLVCVKIENLTHAHTFANSHSLTHTRCNLTHAHTHAHARYTRTCTHIDTHIDIHVWT